MFARLRCGDNLPVSGIRYRSGHLWYGICVPCSKRLPGVRDAFSEAFGVKNRLFRYGKGIRCMKTPFFCTEGVFRGTRCSKQASTVRKRYSVPKTGSSGTRRIFKGRRTADSTDCGQPPARRTHFQRRAVPKAAPAAPDASSVRETAPALFVRSDPFHHFLRPANAELVSGGPFPCSFDGTRYQKRPPLGGEQTQRGGRPFLADLLSKSHPDLQATR